ncbi:MAG: PilZ domain-containing protein, partial [Flavisolibacter sp.]
MNAISIYGGIICFLGIVLLSVIYYFWKVHSQSELDYSTSLSSHQTTGADKREHPRADVNWAALMETPDGRIDAQVKNISLGGAFICCKKLLSIGEVFPLTMIGPDNEPVMATAKVVWSNVNVPEEKVVNRGMGVRFLKMSDRH